MNENIRFFAVFALAGVLAGSVSLIPKSAATKIGDKDVGVEAVENLETVLPFGSVSVEAKSVYILDGATGNTIFEKNADAQLPLASITKVMTAAAALSVSPAYALVPIADGTEQWTLKNILSYFLTSSSNEAAVAVAESAGSFVSGNTESSENRKAFISEMNKKARELGLLETYFLNETGLDENTELTGGYGSARDVSHLMLSALYSHPEVFGATTAQKIDFKEENGNSHEAENTNKIVDSIPLLRASKTGFTDLAGGNLSVVFDAGVAKPIVITVLGSTQEGRFDDVIKLVNATLEYLQRNDK
jgi:D-alanyl-D-alanine carboxypeptidase